MKDNFFSFKGPPCGGRKGDTITAQWYKSLQRGMHREEAEQHLNWGWKEWRKHPCRWGSGQGNLKKTPNLLLKGRVRTRQKRRFFWRQNAGPLLASSPWLPLWQDEGSSPSIPRGSPCSAVFYCWKP